MVQKMEYTQVRDVLDFYEQLTGKKLLYDNTVQGPCQIVVSKQVTKAEAIQIMDTALLLNGFTLVPGPGNIVRVLGGGGARTRSFGPPLYADLSQIPDSDMVISFMFKLEYADPAEVNQTISPYLSPSPYTSLLPLPKAQALVVTENTSIIRSLAQIIAQIDRKPADVVSEFIPIERADAKEVLEKLTAIFEKQQSQPGAPGAPAPAAPPAPQPGEAQPVAPGANGEVTLSEDSLIVGKIKLTADVRTNRIHVVTRPINMPFIRRLIREFDSDIPFGEPTTRSLRFVSAGDVLDVIVKAITEPGGKEEGGGGTGAKPAAPISNPSGYSGVGGSSSSSGSNLGNEELATREVDTTPEARIVGNTKIIADKRANAIIVLGNEEVKSKIFKILDEIDVRAPQVMLTVVIGELTLGDSKAFGVQYLAHLQNKPLISSSTVVTTIPAYTSTTTSGTTTTTNSFGASTSTTTVPVTTGTGASGSFAAIANTLGLGGVPDLSTLTNAAAVASAFGSGGGVTALIAATKSLDLLVHALESTNRFHVISRPMIFTSNNKKAIIASGQQVAIPGQIQSGFGVSGTGGSLNNGLVSTSNVEYKDVFLKLEVQPLINSDNEVTLDIVQEVNSLASTGGVVTSSGITAPTINSRKIKTTVSVANEATVVLGGLVQEQKSLSKSGIPVLSRIPVLGALFRSESSSTDRTELIVMIRPTVTNSPVSAVKAGERAQEGLNFPPDLEHTLDPPGTKVKVNKSKEMLIQPQAVLRTEK